LANRDHADEFAEELETSTQDRRDASGPPAARSHDPANPRAAALGLPKQILLPIKIARIEDLGRAAISRDRHPPVCVARQVVPL
jgi:hypothetical protein